MKISGVLFKLILLSAMLLSGMAQAQDSREVRAQPSAESMHFGWADVLRVDPVYEEGQPGDAQQECYEERVEPAASTPEADDAKRTGSTLLGAIIGGIIGNRFGKGDGRKAATAAGAVAGGVVGNNIAAGSDNSHAGSRFPTQRHCRPVDGAIQRQIVAYDVEYRYRGEIYSSRMNHDPGDRLRIRVSVTPAD
jgi:uncharacterized protein YcfJ